MGSRIFSNNTNLIGGHDFTNAADREKIARALEIPVDRIPTRNSWAYDEIIDGIRSGKVKGLWVIATNTAHSWIHQNETRHLLDKLDFLVVQDMYHTTETAQRAHLVLPAAAWGEKEGTFINSERRIGLAKKVCRSPGDALSDFQIFRLVAHYWGCSDLFKSWTSPEAVFQLMKRCSARQPCDITGIENYRMLDENGGIQWPWKSSNGQTPPQQRRLFADGRFFHADGKARFLFEDPRPAAELPDAEYPFTLLTGRGSAAQWHTQTRTGKSAVLRSLYPGRIYVEINPGDARHLKVRDGARVTIRSRRGAITARAFVTSIVQPGQIFIPMHYEATNQLTFPQFDPCSRQPAYKMAAVAIEAHS
jgi:assimilatory nitrate reductase catalytic subunit